MAEGTVRTNIVTSPTTGKTRVQLGPSDTKVIIIKVKGKVVPVFN
jgi:hypothetical protein